MDREIRHQDRGGDIHGPRGIEERGPQDSAFQLHDIEPGLLERNPDDLKGTGAGWFRDLERLRPLLVFQQGAPPGGGGHAPQPGLDITGLTGRYGEDLSGHRVEEAFFG